VTDAVLQDLGLGPEDALCLSPRLRDQLVHFMLRWQHYAALDACLTELLAARVLQSHLDVRAQMLLELGELDAAWETMRQRHQRSASAPSRVLSARILLARREVQPALEQAQALVDEEQESALAWGLLGEVRLAMGEHAAALAAYRRVNELVPGSRAYLLGMLCVHQAQGDWVTASAYAVRLQESAAPENPLPVSYLRRLRQYFLASHETNRVADIEAELARRRASETRELGEALVAELGRKPAPRVTGAREAQPAQLTQALDSYEKIPVSADEQRELTEAVQRLFGYPSLLPGQAQIMACTLRGEDVLAVLPTGGGKSLCYQLPALLASSGSTLVISPLIALMKDQVDKLPDGVKGLATTINSSLEGDELARRLEGVRAGRFRLVYAAPERLRQPTFLHALRRAGINRLVVDEVHCVSMWGHDFRPDYLYIGEARRALGKPALLSMTATAAPRVREDILQRLGKMRVIATDVMRPNLRLEVLRTHTLDDKLRQLLSFCQEEPGAGIVYASSRARCEELAELLRSQGVSAVHYHAGIENRAEVQDQFMSGHARVVVATVAFGMGIDKPDIRFIVHYEPPNSLEAYYQEAGRAGRDGLPARCVLMYAPSDRSTLTRRSQRDELSEEFLRELYAATKRILGQTSVGRVPIDDLLRELQVEDKQARVGISLLEQVGLLKRWQDVPRSVSLRLKRAAPADQTELQAFCQCAHLAVGKPVTCDPFGLASQAGLDVRHLEQRILGWTDAACLECRPSARDPLVELLPAPKDARERLRILLEQYEQVQRQRVAEMVAYATTRRCRHGHISAYFGGRAIHRCAVCDNCVAPPPVKTDSRLPDEASQLQLVLKAAEHGWGPHNLVLILRGRPEVPPAARGQECFGALAYRSEGALMRMVEALVRARFLEEKKLEHGGVMVRSTQAGRRAANDRMMLRAVAAKPERSPSLGKGRRERVVRPRREVQAPTEDGHVDGDLLERLRAWRLDKARELKVSPFIVAHNALLRNIAAARPRTPEELQAVKGIGPHKFEQYGAELLALVQASLKQRQG